MEGVTIPGQSIVQLFINAQNITDVGFGIGQILPILVYGLTLQKGETLVLEQPEIHLHPSLQMLLADFIIAIKKSGKRVILETHSDHIINRIVRRAVELSIDIDDILMLYIEKKNNLSQTKRISIDLNVGIGDAPKGFFDQYASETDSIIQAGYQNYMKRENENV